MSSKPPTVLFLTYGFGIGGAETLFVNLLNRFDRTQINPLVVSLAEPGQLEANLDPSIELIRIPRRWKYDLRPSTKLASLLVERDIKSAFVLSFFCYFFMKLALRKARRSIQVYVSSHSTKPRSAKEYFFDMMYTRMLSGTEQVVTTCESQRDYLSRLYRIHKRNLQIVIYNGIDTEYWSLPSSSFDRMAERARWGIPEQAYVILNIARYRKEKRHDIMVKAFAQLPNPCDGRPVYLVFVGSGDSKLELQTRQLARELDVLDRIVFAGTHSDIRPFCWLSDLFTLSSTSETFSIAALEAMSTGLPCVLTNVGGASEMVTNNMNGIVVEPGSVRAIAIGWESCLQHLPSMLRARVRESVLGRFSLTDCVKRYEDLLVRGETALRVMPYCA